MKRKQIYLEERSERQLKALANRTGRSEAALIREALDRYLEGPPEAPLPGAVSPLLDLVGLARKGPRDGAAHHDRYLHRRR